MVWIDLITALSLIQFIIFGMLVGAARGKYAVHAPAITGHAIFERYYRIHANTLELLMLFIPSLWLAAKYWRLEYMAIVGGVYLIGRILYFRAYVKDPDSRTLGFGLSFLPIIFLLMSALVGIVMSFIGDQ